MLVLLAHLWLAAAAHLPELRDVPTSRPVIALAVNVVWGGEYLPPIVAALKAQGARATFFLGGAWAEKHPDLARMLRREGMEIGSHGDAHRHVGSLGVEANVREIALADEKIARATGVHPTLYAPAYGELSPAVYEAARREGVRIVMWSIDTIDWRTWHTPEIITGRVLSRLRPGAIVLMHPTDRTAAALPGLLRVLHTKGYRVVGVQELVRSAGHDGPAGEKGGMSRHRTVA
jgi:peptidoglycan/xylan/chitin deacetylase (PgdA/CDA1 family)